MTCGLWDRRRLDVKTLLNSRLSQIMTRLRLRCALTVLRNPPTWLRSWMRGRTWTKPSKLPSWQLFDRQGRAENEQNECTQVLYSWLSLITMMCTYDAQFKRLAILVVGCSEE
jgi:hypothetical protein